MKKFSNRKRLFATFLFLSFMVNNEQHNLMSTSRFNKMRDALMEMFPNLSVQDAEDLTWGGLQKTPAYFLLDTPTKIRIENTNKEYKKSLKGTKC